jgi:tRNA (cmo5U34)-methyltransferase
MRRLTFDLGSCFVQAKKDVLDLGCSRGSGLAPFIDKFGADCRYIGLDFSGPMVDAARERFRHEVKVGLVDVRQHDLRDGLPPLMPSLILSILTLQFVAIEHRQRVVADAFRILRPGGAMIVTEKTIGPDAVTHSLYVEQYHSMKRSHGYTADQIEAKANSLQGVLVPLTAEANVAMLRAEGFRVQPFWQSLNFAGWLAIKPKVMP